MNLVLTGGANGGLNRGGAFPPQAAWPWAQGGYAAAAGAEASERLPPSKKAACRGSSSGAGRAPRGRGAPPPTLQRPQQPQQLSVLAPSSAFPSLTDGLLPQLPEWLAAALAEQQRMQQLTPAQHSRALSGGRQGGSVDGRIGVAAVAAEGEQLPGEEGKDGDPAACALHFLEEEIPSENDGDDDDDDDEEPASQGHQEGPPAVAASRPSATFVPPPLCPPPVSLQWRDSEDRIVLRTLLSRVSEVPHPTPHTCST